LQQFKADKQLTAYPYYLGMLWRAVNLPDEIWVELEEFDYKPKDIVWKRRNQGLKHKLVDQDPMWNPLITHKYGPGSKRPKRISRMNLVYMEGITKKMKWMRSQREKPSDRL
jgi:hypothetical protein